MQHSELNAQKEKKSASFKFFETSFIKELKSIYWTEKQLIKLLGKSEKSASTRYAKASFKGHKTASIEHIKRIELIFDLLGEKSAGKTCHEISGLVAESQQILKATDKNSLSRDLGLLRIIQKVEQLEIKKYNGLINLANELGNYDVILLLESTLLEEEEAKETFSAIMEDTLNDEKFQIKVLENSEDEEELEHLEAV